MSSQTAAHVIAAGMREMARLHGMVPEEERLIEALESELEGPRHEQADVRLLATDEERRAFLRSVILVALADGSFSEEERALVSRWARELGVDDDGLRAVVREVAGELLASFRGVRVFRDRVFEVGRALGLDAADVEAILAG